MSRAKFKQTTSYFRGVMWTAAHTMNLLVYVVERIILITIIIMFDA